MKGQDFRRIKDAERKREERQKMGENVEEIIKEVEQIALQQKLQNPQDSNQVDSSRRTYTIKEIVTNAKLKNCHLKAKVTQLPYNVRKGMVIFRVKDTDGVEIQCVSFQEAALQFLKQLRVGKEYLFSGFILHKNRVTDGDEFKFKKETKIELLSGDTKIDQLPQSDLSQRTLSQLLSQDNPLKDNFFIVGIVSYISMRSKFRKLNIKDKNGNVIDLVLWEEIKQDIDMDKVYKFTGMRVKRIMDSQGKISNKYVELHSSKKTSVTLVQDQKILKLFNQKPLSYYESPVFDLPTTFKKPPHQKQTNHPPQGSSIITLLDLLFLADSDQKSSENNKNILSTSNPFVECCLKLDTQGVKFFVGQQDALTYFSFYCGHCRRLVTATLDKSDWDTIICGSCKGNDVTVKWNLRVKAMDYHNQVPCSVSNQTSEKFFNLSSKDGYVLYIKNYKQFLVLLHKFNYQQRVCMFQLKKEGINTYYHILKIYDKDIKSALERAIEQLKKMTKQSKTNSKMAK